MAADLLNKFVDNTEVPQDLWENTCKECMKPGHKTFLEGHFEKGDLCLRKCYVKAGHERLHAVKRYVEHPVDGVKATHTIHAVLAYDHRPDGKSRGAEIVEGGIDQPHVKVEMESKPGLKGMEFTVIIIGK